MTKDRRLKRAIRAFTVDAGTPEAPRPNGPAEAAFSRLFDELRNKVLPLLPEAMAQRILGLAIAHCEADAERLRELREAAEDWFREDFKKEPLELRLSVLGRLEVWWTTAVVHRLERVGLLEPTCFCYYGSFPGGDPRDFRPDPDNEPVERARHTAACAAWEMASHEEKRDVAVATDRSLVTWGGCGLGEVLCEHHRRVRTPTPRLLLARRRVLAWFSRRNAT